MSRRPSARTGQAFLSASGSVEEGSGSVDKGSGSVDDGSGAAGAVS